MDWIHIEGIPPYDGRFEFDLDGGAFTVREWGWIKRHSGYLPLTLWDGLLGKDAELLAVFALVSLVRAGKVHRDDVPAVWERFADAPGVVTVRLELGPREEELDPPTPPSSNGSETDSGGASRTSSEISAATPPVSGTPDSDSSASPPARVSGS